MIIKTPKSYYNKFNQIFKIEQKASKDYQEILHEKKKIFSIKSVWFWEYEYYGLIFLEALLILFQSKKHKMNFLIGEIINVICFEVLFFLVIHPFKNENFKIFQFFYINILLSIVTLFSSDEFKIFGCCFFLLNLAQFYEKISSDNNVLLLINFILSIFIKQIPKRKITINVLLGTCALFSLAGEQFVFFLMIILNFWFINRPEKQLNFE